MSDLDRYKAIKFYYNSMTNHELQEAHKKRLEMRHEVLEKLDIIESIMVKRDIA